MLLAIYHSDSTVQIPFPRDPAAWQSTNARLNLTVACNAPCELAVEMHDAVRQPRPHSAQHLPPPQPHERAAVLLFEPLLFDSSLALRISQLAPGFERTCCGVTSAIVVASDSGKRFLRCKSCGIC